MTDGRGLADFNSASAAELTTALLTLTHSAVWAGDLADGRPYPDLDALLDRSDQILAGIGVDQIDSALSGHPRIGERATGLDAESADRSAREQAGMESAHVEVTRALARANQSYEARFGRIYLVAAAGLSAPELLAKALGRLQNDPMTELEVVRTELARITRRRLMGRFG